MTETIHRFAKNVYSQNGEDGIIEEVIKRLQDSGIDTTKFVCVEFGACDGKFCSNTAALKDQGLKSLMYDMNPSSIEVAQVTITPDNVNIVLPEKCNILSIDVDGNDAAIWEAYKGKPDLVVIEINSSLNPTLDHFSLEKGSSFSYMNKIAERKGYFLLCHTGNCIYIVNEHKDKFPDADVTFKTDWLC